MEGGASRPEPAKRQLCDVAIVDLADPINCCRAPPLDDADRNNTAITNRYVLKQD